MSAPTIDQTTRDITPLVADLFEIGAVYQQQNEVILSLTPRFASRTRIVKLLRERLDLAGYRFRIHDQGDVVLLALDPRRRLRIPPMNIILFGVTIVSVYVVPVLYFNLFGMSATYQPAETPGALDSVMRFVTAWFQATWADLRQGAGLEFTVAMVSILLVHEMGHFIASRRRHIITSWPYFIPAPNILGTFGAVIKSRSPFFNRRDLIEVGAAGPIAGWVVAVFWLLWGLSQSHWYPIEAFGPKQMAFLMEGESIFMRLATLTIIGPAPDGHFYMLTEAAFAGWAGLLVTAINLLPIGQLDGGHILYGLVRRHQHLLGMLAMVGLFVMGFQSMIWWLFAGFGLIFGVKHPPTLDDQQTPSRTARVLGMISIAILVLSFTPVPFR